MHVKGGERIKADGRRIGKRGRICTVKSTMDEGNKTLETAIDGKDVPDPRGGRGEIDEMSQRSEKGF